MVLLDAVICMCCSGHALRTLRVRGISGPAGVLLQAVSSEERSGGEECSSRGPR